MHETTNRCNGHIQVSPAGKASKRDRKGCKKGKIEAIMKNSMGSTKPKVHIDSIFKKKRKLLNTLNRYGGNNAGGLGITAGSVIKNEIIDDPYTFTDCEPQTQTSVGLYLTTSSSGLINSNVVTTGTSGVSGAGGNRRDQLTTTTSGGHLVNSSTTTTTSGTTTVLTNRSALTQYHNQLSNLLSNSIISSNNNSNNNNNNAQVLLGGDCVSISNSNNNNSTSYSNSLNNNIKKAVTTTNVLTTNSSSTMSSTISSSSFRSSSSNSSRNVTNNFGSSSSSSSSNSSSNKSSSNVTSRSNSIINNRYSNSSSNFVTTNNSHSKTVSVSSNSNDNNNSNSRNNSNSHNRAVVASNKSSNANCVADGTSKTMNRLQADIARNKVIVKRRKIICQQSPTSNSSSSSSSSAMNCSSHNSIHHQDSSTNNTVVVKSEPNAIAGSNQRYNHHQQQQQNLGGQQQQNRTFAKVSIPAKRLHRQTTWQRERRIRHEALQRIHEAQLEAADVKRDLFPLGLDASESDDDCYANGVDDENDEVYQRHWFMGCGGADYDGAGVSIRGRESRLTQLRSELRRRLRQVWRGIERTGEPPPDLVHAVVTAARTQPTATAMLINPQHFESANNQNKLNRAKVSMLDVKQCSLCQRKALPCTRHCTKHIMYNVDQLLFEYCTGRLDDKTQCRVPVFDIAHQMPLCPQHARKQENSVKTPPDVASKKSRKKSKASSLLRSTKRGKKKKKKPPTPVSIGSANNSSIKSMDNHLDMNHCSSLTDGGDGLNGIIIGDRSPETVMTSVGIMQQPMVSGVTTTASAVPTSIGTGNVSSNIILDGIVNNGRQHDLLTSVAGTKLSSNTSSTISSCIPVSQVEIQVQLEEEVPEEVLAIASLDPAELASQASRLLEDQDLTNMLNIPPDAFNDLFTEDKNGEYEPTREETEELERALEAVDKDVRSLERMTRSMPLTMPLETMTTLLDDPVVSSAIPGVYAGVGVGVGVGVGYPNGFTSSVQTDLRHS